MKGRGWSGHRLQLYRNQSPGATVLPSSKKTQKSKSSPAIARCFKLAGLFRKCFVDQSKQVCEQRSAQGLLLGLPDAEAALRRENALCLVRSLASHGEGPMFRPMRLRGASNRSLTALTRRKSFFP